MAGQAVNVFMDGRVFAGGDAQRVLVIGFGLIALFGDSLLAQVVSLLLMAYWLRQIREAS